MTAIMLVDLAHLFALEARDAEDDLEAARLSRIAERLFDRALRMS